MSTFQDLLTQLSSEYERVDNALADALAELQARRGQDVRADILASRNPSGGRRPQQVVDWQDQQSAKGLRGYTSFASTGSQDSMDEAEEEEEEEEEEHGEALERGRTLSSEPTALKVEERPTIKLVVEEGPGLAVSRGANANAHSNSASEPAGLVPTDRNVGQYSHDRKHTSSRLSVVLPRGDASSDGSMGCQASPSSVRTQDIGQTTMKVKDRCSPCSSTSPIVEPVSNMNKHAGYDEESPRRAKQSRDNEQLTSFGPPQWVTARISQACAQVVPGVGAERASPRLSRSLSSLKSYREDAMPPMGRRSVREFQAATRWVINPEHSAALEKWDQITIVALAFVALVTPVQVSMIEAKLDAMFFVNSVVDFIFFCDMILQFFLMYPQRNNDMYSLEHRHPKIIAHYLKTWFTIDCISTIPFDLFAVLSNSEGVMQLKIVKTIRLMRLLKLIRVLRASRIFRRFETRMSITYGRLALLKFFVILAVITHWLANLWALTLVIVDASEGLPRWVDALTELEANVEVKTKDSPAKLYVACLYFTSYTITSVGYGDIGPTNIYERVVLTFMIIVCGISWAVVLGQVCGIVATLDKDEQAFRATMDELNGMIQDRQLPGSMRSRLRSFFLSNKTAQKRARHLSIVSAMSPGLRAEVSWEINRFWLDKVTFLRPFLAEAHVHHNTGIVRSLRTFVLDMSLMMEQVVRAQSEVFGVPHVMYILNRGLVARMCRLFRSGSVWGADFVLSDRRLLEPVESYALTYIELTTLSRQRFFGVVQRHSRSFPQISRTVRRYCCWLAFQRALMLEARRRQELVRSKAQDTLAPMPSVTGTYERVQSI